MAKKSNLWKREIKRTLKKELSQSARHVRGEIRKAAKHVAAEPGKWVDTFLKSLGL